MASETTYGALEAYVRFRLNELVAAGHSVVELAQRSELPPAGIHQVRSGKLGIGTRTLPRYAKLLGMSVPELLTAAEQWDAEHGATARKTVREAARSPELAEAIQAVKALQGATDAQIEAIVAAFGADRFRDRPTTWWVTTLLAELEADRRAQLHPETAAREAAKRRAQHRKLRREKDGIDRSPRPPPVGKKHAAG